MTTAERRRAYECRETLERANWLSVARQVLAGEWPDPDDSTREALTIGLRGIGLADCQKAVARLEKRKKARKMAEK